MVAASALTLLGCRSPRGGSATAGAISVRHAVVPASPSPTDASAFMVIDNDGAVPDSLTAVSSPDAEMVMLHETVGQQMEMVEGVTVPPGGRVLLVPGGYHLMLHGLSRQATVGDTLTLRLQFLGAGALLVRVPVLRYTDAVDEVSPP